MFFELIISFSDCAFEKLGMESGEIPDDNIQASTWRDIYYPWKARLNGKLHWLSAKNTGSEEWIQADIGYQTIVSGVVTQGDGGLGNADWVTAIKVSSFKTSTNDTEIYVMDKFGIPIVSSSINKPKTNQSCTFKHCMCIIASIVSTVFYIFCLELHIHALYYRHCTNLFML